MRELTSSKTGNFPATVKFPKPGDTFTGILDGVKAGKFGQEYTLRVVSGTAFIGRPSGTKNEKGENNYSEVEVKVGEKVTTETSKQLVDKLSKAIVGEKIEITFLGWKTNPKGGRSFKDFKVLVVE